MLTVKICLISRGIMQKMDNIYHALIFLSCRKLLIQRGKIIYQRQIEWTCFHALIN